MKVKPIIMFINIIILAYVSNTTSVVASENNSDPMGYAYWKNNVALNKNINFKTSANFETSYFETELFSIASLVSVDNKMHFSSNSLPGMFVFSTLVLAGMSEDEFRFCMIVFGGPIILGNAKVYIPVFTDNIRVGGGFNTDYYLFYKNSVIFSEALLGFKINVSKVKIFADCRFPINGSYLENKKPYISVGIGLYQTIIDPD